MALASLVMIATSGVTAAAVPSWTSPNHYRVLLNVDPGAAVRKNSPATVSFYPQDILASKGSTGAFDEHTIEVIGYDASGQPVVFDATRPSYEQYLLPWRMQKYYRINKVTLSFVMPDHTVTQYAVYFDTKESGLGKPMRYPGIVGDGDWFTEGYGRREVNACRYDTFCDLDGDGDLDLFKGGTEPFVYVYENVGANKFVDRGRFTNGGDLMTFPMDGNNRSWLSVQFCDWDNDGDQDMFIHSPTGPYAGHITRYTNVTTPGGPPTFTGPVTVLTNTGKRLGSTGGATMCFVDYDGDGKKDLLLGRDYQLEFHKNVGTDSIPVFDDGQYVQANGVTIRLFSPCAEFADIDNDGDLDMFLGTESGRVYWFTNVGTRTSPVYARGRIIAYYSGGYTALGSRVKIADFDGDGLLDFVVGRYWENNHWGEQPHMFGRLYKNTGTATAPRWEARDAWHGCPYTEQFQRCEATRQNGVRAVDWNNDGLTDLVAGDEDGFVLYFRNTTNHLFPVFTPGERLTAGGEYIKVLGEDDRRVRDGYARPDVADWNNDGKKDLIVADGRGWIWYYRNTGTDANPVLAAGERLTAYNSTRTVLHPIDGTARSSVLVCDWDNDGKKDIVFAMVGHFPDEDELAAPEMYSKYFDWPARNAAEQWKDRGFLYYRNVSSDPANPVLDYPKWITAGGSIIDYTRPNLGSYIDWDGDGKKDFIGCEFENNVRFYRNMASGGVGVEPAFTSSASGQTIVMPFTVTQMISGADAVDWNRDGDLDILTGQGHGGSSLRFYERDYINDFTSNNNTYPIVSVETSDAAVGIAGAKQKWNGDPVTVPGVIVTAGFADFLYVESQDRSNGIRVEKIAHGKQVGEKIDVLGSMSTTPDGERFIAATDIAPNGEGSVEEMALSGKAVGGADTSGQIGITGGIGRNTIGLLVRIFGKCTANVRGDFDGNKFIFIDDGSGITSRYRALDGSYVEVAGVKVEFDDPSIAQGDYVTARGISSIELIDGIYQNRLLPRDGMNDVVEL